MSAGVLYTFGFIVAATLGCTAGSVDLTDGMFRHLVITGRSRLALYLARIPAGLAIIVSLVAIGFTIVCAVCVFAAPSKLNYDGVDRARRPVPKRPGRAGPPTTPPKSSATSPTTAKPRQGVGCDNRPGQPARVVVIGPGGQPVPASAAQAKAAAIQIADQNYADYTKQFLLPVELADDQDRAVARTRSDRSDSSSASASDPCSGNGPSPSILMIVLEIILTPIVIRTRIPHFINLQRGIVGVATAHLEPGQLPLAFGGGGQDFRVTESTTTAICVILAWLIGWTVLGAWRMMTRDA